MVDEERAGSCEYVGFVGRSMGVVVGVKMVVVVVVVVVAVMWWTRWLQVSQTILFESWFVQTVGHWKSHAQGFEDSPSHKQYNTRTIGRDS